MTTTGDFRPGAKITANVELEVGADGKAHIGCHEFSPGDVLAFAKDVKVTKPAWVTDGLNAGTLLTAESKGKTHYFLWAERSRAWGATPTLWHLESGTHADEEYWTSRKGFENFKVIYTPGGEYTDTCSARYRPPSSIDR